DCIGEFTKYNWCKYVVDHFHNGFKAAKQTKEKKGTAAMFIGADINLLMQEKILEWLQMAKGVIEGEIQIVKDSMELKMEEDKATQRERQEQEDNDDSSEVNSNKDQESDEETRNTVSR
ncbi:hypothetical protein LINPERHAP1_LOCUS17445, partial [Linum perenne]